MTFLLAIPPSGKLPQPLDSLALQLPPPPPKFDIFYTHTPLPALLNKEDPGGIGFLDEVGGSVDGLMSCTESLGFESSDERVVDSPTPQPHPQPPPIFDSSSRKTSKWKRSTTTTTTTTTIEERINCKANKKFPPPLSSLNCDGRPTFLLRPVRTDGRLEIREVIIDRPEVLLASRQDGRLRLHLVRRGHEEENYYTDAQETELAEAENEEEIEEEIEENSNSLEEEEKEKEEERSEEWRVPPRSSGGGDSYRWCHEVVHHHYHHELQHVWRQNCVTTG